MYQLNWGISVGEELVDDAYEDNDSAVQAYGMPIDTWLSDDQGPPVLYDADWYRFDVPAGQHLALSLRLPDEATILLARDDEGSLDYLFYVSGGDPDGVFDEPLALTPGTYYCIIDSDVAYTGASYDLRWSLVAPSNYRHLSINLTRAGQPIFGQTCELTLPETVLRVSDSSGSLPPIPPYPASHEVTAVFLVDRPTANQ